MRTQMGTILQFKNSIMNLTLTFFRTFLKNKLKEKLKKTLVNEAPSSLDVVGVVCFKHSEPLTLILEALLTR